MAEKTVATLDESGLDLSPGTILDVGDACDQGFSTDMRRGRWDVGELIACPDCGQEHQIVSVTPIDIAHNIRIVKA
ncbi:hypothetical protein [Pseudonocardia sp. WMMC193]|uniref:hypothetical protein n=1 Tax=Pseudonocardia sp. WMMC193 TaxID=2911965 RepID=UPI001F3C06EF|nr:hypothetical protein [Pseudonocardia sp. WMMC193]MCF7552583.1 hypothetical protein [Pseudonocardia sp. WMMC193]